MSYNEEDTKLHLITPALQAKEWRGARITMEYAITAGQIVLSGDSHEQLSPTYTDYLLCYAESLRRGLSIRQLAVLLDIHSHSHIVNLEAGRKQPSVDLILKVGELFQVSPNQLMLDDQEVD
jgi:DNA-binding XRE family transcriptional regulator